MRDVRSGIDVERATAAEPTYEITVHSRQTTLGEFDPRPTRQGCVSSHVWDQRGGVQEGRPERYPVTPLFGPNVAQVAHEGATSDAIREVVSDFPNDSGTRWKGSSVTSFPALATTRAMMRQSESVVERLLVADGLKGVHGDQQAATPQC